ncbi:MAG: hypothetical protein ACTSR8_04775 [Promethearchaeota archaeon]
MKKTHLMTLSILFFMLFIPFSLAHSPIVIDGNSLETAVEIEDPTKSWAVYSEIEDESDIKYYKFEIEKDQNIYISLFTPHEDEDFEVRLLLMGPGLSENTTVPSRIDTPSKSGAEKMDYYKELEEYFEPFTPSVIYNHGEIDIDAPKSGEYYIVIYSENSKGSFGFALGKREPLEIFLLPIAILEIYQWEGQSLLLFSFR